MSARIWTGRCSCAAVRVCVEGDPVRVSVCHCKECQRRTGSAFGIGCYFPKERFELTAGAPRTFERRSDSGRWLRFHFCPECATTLFWYAEAVPALVGVAAGVLEDTDCVQPRLHVWASSAQRWVEFPKDAEVLQESNLSGPALQKS